MYNLHLLLDNQLAFFPDSVSNSLCNGIFMNRLSHDVTCICRESTTPASTEKVAALVCALPSTLASIHLNTRRPSLSDHFH